MGKGESTYIPGNLKRRFALGKFMHCWPNPFVKPAPQFWLLSTHIVMYSLLCVCVEIDSVVIVGLYWYHMSRNLRWCCLSSFSIWVPYYCARGLSELCWQMNFVALGIAIVRLVSLWEWSQIELIPREICVLKSMHLK